MFRKYWLFIVLSLNIVFEFLAYYLGFFKVVYAWFWVAQILLGFAFVCAWVVKSCARDKKLIPVSLGILSLLILCGNLRISDLSYEALIQLASGLNLWKLPDLGITGKSFLGYPNKQYLLVSIPSLLFGRTIFNAQFGYALFFVIGLLVSYIALVRYTSSSRTGLIYVLWCLSFKYYSEYYLYFEQSLLPIALMFFGLGFYLNWLRSNKKRWLYLLYLLLDLMVFSYTPSLASVVLFVGFLILVKPSKSCIFVSFCACVSLILYVLTSKGSDSLNISSNIVDESIRYFESITSNTEFFGIMYSVIVIYLILGICNKLGFMNYLVSYWCIAVIIASNLLKGYTHYGLDKLLVQRAMLVLCVIALMICLKLQRLFDWTPSSYIAIVAILFIIVAAHNFSKPSYAFDYYNIQYPIKYIYQDMEDRGIDVACLITDNSVWFNTPDYTNYFDTILLQYDSCSYLGDFEGIVYSDSQIKLRALGEEIYKLEVKDLRRDTVVWYYCVLGNN